MSRFARNKVKHLEECCSGPQIPRVLVVMEHEAEEAIAEWQRRYGDLHPQDSAHRLIIITISNRETPLPKAPDSKAETQRSRRVKRCQRSCAVRPRK
ncbi:MAG: hypothetical protein WHX93_10940 [bacterium]